MKRTNRDVFNPDNPLPRVIYHPVNCLGVWGVGFPLFLSRTYPHLELSFKRWIFTAQYVRGANQLLLVQPQVWICNAVVMDSLDFTTPHIPFDLINLRCSLGQLFEFVKARQASFHWPLYHCFLHGGVWRGVEEVLRDQLSSYGIDVYLHYLIPSISNSVAGDLFLQPSPLKRRI